MDNLDGNSKEYQNMANVLYNKTPKAYNDPHWGGIPHMAAGRENAVIGWERGGKYRDTEGNPIHLVMESQSGPLQEAKAITSELKHQSNPANYDIYDGSHGFEVRFIDQSGTRKTIGPWGMDKEEAEKFLSDHLSEKQRMLKNAGTGMTKTNQQPDDFGKYGNLPPDTPYASGSAFHQRTIKERISRAIEDGEINPDGSVTIGWPTAISHPEKKTDGTPHFGVYGATKGEQEEYLRGGLKQISKREYQYGPLSLVHQATEQHGRQPGWYAIDTRISGPNMRGPFNSVKETVAHYPDVETAGNTKNLPKSESGILGDAIKEVLKPFGWKGEVGTTKLAVDGGRAKRKLIDIPVNELDTDALPFLQTAADDFIAVNPNATAYDLERELTSYLDDETPDHVWDEIAGWFEHYTSARKGGQSKTAFTVTIPKQIVDKIKKSGFPMFGIAATVGASDIAGSEKEGKRGLQ